MKEARKRILLGHLASFGDCLCATAVARQIKHDFPGCHLTWGVGSLYREIIDDNPHVDEIWEIPVEVRVRGETAWRSFARTAKRRVRNGEFDQAFFTQINPDNYGNFDGTVRASIFRNYPRPITVPIAPVLRLRSDEVDHVRQFAEAYGLSKRQHVVLFECASRSRQSFVTPDYALEVARLLLARLEDCAIILSSSVSISSPDPRIIDGSNVPFRQNAELTKYCTLFVGCYSGISWLSTSDWAKPLPMIQVLNRSASVFASMLHDAEYFGLPTNHMLEMTDCTIEHLANCMYVALTGGIGAAQDSFHERIPLDLTFYMNTFMRALLRQGRIYTILRSMYHVAERYGIKPFGRYLASQLFRRRST